MDYAKPVYLEVITQSIDKLPITEIQRYDPDKHDRGDIIGKASFFRGFLNGRFYPGGYLKVGLGLQQVLATFELDTEFEQNNLHLTKKVRL